MTETLARFVTDQAKRLEEVGIDQAKAEIELILCSLLKCDRLKLYMEGIALITEEIIFRFEEIIKQRLTRQPLQFILRQAWFYGRSFYVTPDVMAPTPETELLVEAAMRHCRVHNVSQPRILDIGVGSGVISVTLANELPNSKIVAVDISEPALEVARKNAQDLKVSKQIEFRQSDFLSSLTSVDKFDLILSNPPYITEEEYKSVEPEVKADPLIAMVSGADGLDAVRVIVRDAPNYLAPGGRIMFEIGAKQSGGVHQLIENDQRYQSIIVLQDLNDYDRIVILSCD